MIVKEKYVEAFKALGIDLRTLNFSDYHERGMKAEIKSRSNNISHAQQYKRLIWKDIKNYRDEYLKSYVIKLDTKIPICLSYFGELTIQKDEKIFSNLANLIIHPFENTTYLIFSTLSENYKSLKSILKKLSSEEVAHFILSSTLYVTDNWLVNPDFYNSSFPEYAKELLEKALSLPLTRKKNEN